MRMRRLLKRGHSVRSHALICECQRCGFVAAMMAGEKEQGRTLHAVRFDSNVGRYEPVSFPTLTVKHGYI